MLEAGIGLGIGTDGAASNNRLDLFQEMRQAALLAKAVSGDAGTLPAHRVLEMATLGGAAALGLADRIGSLVAGKQADLTAVDLSDWPLQPCYDPVSHLVYVAGRDQVSHVWVGGKLRIQDKMPCDFAPQALLELAKLWQNSLSNQV
jgi:5-methylthioadenosine/S-adenosylhomocysteine deaminase